MPYARNTIRVNVPKRSGFDKTHRNSGSLQCGTITPLLFDEVIPSSRLSLKLNLATQLPPLTSDTYMNLKLKAEAFFVPLRLLCKSFEDFFCDAAPYNGSFGINGVVRDLQPRIPYFDPRSGYVSTGPGSLADYLGVRSFDAQIGAISALPFVCYHLVWQEWYRNPRVQNPAFLPSLASPSSSVRHKIQCMPDTYFATSASSSSSIQTSIDPAISLSSVSDSLLYDGVSIFSLRQRNFGQDYFTGARVSAQQGPAVTVDTPVVPDPVTTGDQTRMTIAALRAANSLQMFKERNMLPSSRFVDQNKARYNAQLSDGVAQRPICIGSASYDVGSTGVSMTSPSATGSAGNPFDTVGAQYGRAYASGSDFIISDFTANEPGYILVNVTLVPEVTYYTGMDRLFLRYTRPGSIIDMAHPLLQNVGDQPIFQYELAGNAGSYYNHIVGYQDRFADFMYKPNSVHGALSKDFASPNLSSFVLQRGFSGASPLDLSSSLLEIPTTYLDDVFAVSTGVSGLAAWYDCMLQYRVSMPLAEFSIPSLQDPAYEHGQTVSLRRNGQIF